MKDRPGDNDQDAKRYLIGDDEKTPPDNHELTLGYQLMEMDSLPSKGMFYPKGTVIEFRSVTVPEIKAYSALNEKSVLSINAAVRAVIKKCIKIKGAAPTHLNGLYLTEFDKLYMFFSIRDLTMMKENQENKMVTSSKCSKCGYVIKKEIDHNAFAFYDIPEKLMKWYDDKERAFVIDHTSFVTGPVILRPASVGVISAITNYMVEKEKERNSGDSVYYDDKSLALVQCMFNNHVGINTERIEAKMKEISDYSASKLQAAYHAMDLMLEGIKPTVSIDCTTIRKDNCEGATWEAPIRFQWKSLLDIKNIIGELF